MKKTGSQGVRSRYKMACVPIYEYGQLPIKDGQHAIRALTISNVPQVGWESDDMLHMVLAHGAWGGPITMAPLMRQFVRAAGVDGQPATATLYRDPWFGFGQYAAGHRTSRFEKVALATADRMDSPVHLATHSWAGEGGMEVAFRARHERQAASFIAYTLANRIAEDDMTFKAFLAGGLRELGRGDAVAGPRSLLTIGAVGASAITHGISDIRAAVAECATAFNGRITDRLVLLQDVMPTGVVLAGRDAFFGDGETARTHLREAGFEGAIDVMDRATHMSSVSNYRHGEELYDLTYATIHPELPGSAAYYGPVS